MSDDRPANARGYDLDEFVEVDTVARMKALADPLRVELTELVLERAMSVTELAERVDRPKGTVAYHVNQLVDAGLLKVVHTRQVRAVEERFYGRVARTMRFHDGFMDAAGLPFLDGPMADYDPDPFADGTPVGAELAEHGAGFTTYRRARIPVARAGEYATRLYELTAEFVDEPRDGDVEFGMYVLFFPTRRSESTGRPSSESTDD